MCFRCEAEPYILVMFGWRPLEAAMAPGEVTVEGDHALANAFGQNFQSSAPLGAPSATWCTVLHGSALTGPA